MTAEFFQIILTAVVSLVGLILTGFVVPFLRAKYLAVQDTQAKEFADIAINAVEQLANAGLLNWDSRKAEATSRLKNKFPALTDLEAETLVEGALASAKDLVSKSKAITE
jgi:type II secretory pathway pseudopilin PulG